MTPHLVVVPFRRPHRRLLAASTASAMDALTLQLSPSSSAGGGRESALSPASSETAPAPAPASIGFTPKRSEAPLTMSAPRLPIPAAGSDQVPRSEQVHLADRSATQDSEVVAAASAAVLGPSGMDTSVNTVGKAIATPPITPLFAPPPLPPPVPVPAPAPPPLSGDAAAALLELQVRSTMKWWVARYVHGANPLHPHVAETRHQRGPTDPPRLRADWMLRLRADDSYGWLCEAPRLLPPLVSCGPSLRLCSRDCCCHG